MMTDPTTDTPKYRQATVPGEGSAEAEVVATGESVCVPFNCYENVLVIEEDGSELTYFAPGVGGIKLEPESGDPQETEQLINLTQLVDAGPGRAERRGHGARRARPNRGQRRLRRLLPGGATLTCPPSHARPGPGRGEGRDQGLPGR